MTGISHKIARAAAAFALATTLAVLVVPTAGANGNDGDRATSKPIVVTSSPSGWGSLGDRATSKPIVVTSSLSGWGSLGDRATSKPIFVAATPTGIGSLGDRGTSKPLGYIVPEFVRVPAPDGFDWSDFAIGAAAMLGAVALATGAASRLRGFEARQPRST